MSNRQATNTTTTADRNTILSVAGLSKRFDGREGRTTAVEDVSFDVNDGEFVSIVGPSGCGKSTLFNMVGGLMAPSEGTIRIQGQPVTEPHPLIGMVFQEESTFPWRNVLKNVLLPLETAGEPKDESRERALRLIETVGLKGFENHYPHELSGGMRQRVAIARTLAAKPKLLLMDEPFGALDEQTRLLMGDSVTEIQKQLNQTIVLITHNISEAVQLSDRILLMSYRPGRVKRCINVELPRPRSSEIVGSDDFSHYVAEIWRELRSEAGRGLQDSSEVMA